MQFLHRAKLVFGSMRLQHAQGGSRGAGGGAGVDALLTSPCRVSVAASARFEKLTLPFLLATASFFSGRFESSALTKDMTPYFR